MNYSKLGREAKNHKLVHKMEESIPLVPWEEPVLSLFQKVIQLCIAETGAPSSKNGKMPKKLQPRNETATLSYKAMLLLTTYLNSYL